MHFTTDFGNKLLRDPPLREHSSSIDNLRANRASVRHAIALYTVFITISLVNYVIVAGFFKHGTPCTDDMHLPQVSTQQLEVPHIIDAVYSIAHGLQSHITKHCSSTEFCSNAR